MIKVTDRRRFDSDGKPRENGEAKCGTCNGEGRVNVPPIGTIVILPDGDPSGDGYKDRGDPCPDCDGRGGVR
jgi:DnaJ-class molecular chaperone